METSTWYSRKQKLATKNTKKKETFFRKIVGMGSGSAVEPHGKNSEPHARNRKIPYRTHGTAKISTARTEPQFSRFNHNRKNTNSEKWNIDIYCIEPLLTQYYFLGNCRWTFRLTWNYAKILNI